MNNEKLSDIYEVGQKIERILTHLKLEVADLQHQAQISNRLVRDGVLTGDIADSVAANITKQVWDLIDTAEAEIDEERGGK